MNILNLEAKYPLQTWLNNEVLRKKSSSVVTIDSEIIQFCDDLKKLMWHYDWVWLAAPQIWVNLRIISTTQWSIKGDSWSLLSEKIMINPEVLNFSESKEKDIEACLSLPWMENEVYRSKKIKVKYLNTYWKYKTLSLSWMNARIVQHEIDHLDWVLFPDRAVAKTNNLNFSKFIKN